MLLILFAEEKNVLYTLVIRCLCRTTKASSTVSGHNLCAQYVIENLFSLWWQLNSVIIGYSRYRPSFEILKIVKFVHDRNNAI